MIHAKGAQEETSRQESERKTTSVWCPGEARTSLLFGLAFTLAWLDSFPKGQRASSKTGPSNTSFQHSGSCRMYRKSGWVSWIESCFGWPERETKQTSTVAGPELKKMHLWPHGLNISSLKAKGFNTIYDPKMWTCFGELKAFQVSRHLKTTHTHTHTHAPWPRSPNTFASVKPGESPWSLRGVRIVCRQMQNL